MASERYATRWTCDFCGGTATAAESGPPAGWLSRLWLASPPASGIQVLFVTFDGRQWGDCCAACQGRPLRDLLALLAGRVL